MLQPRELSNTGWAFARAASLSMPFTIVTLQAPTGSFQWYEFQNLANNAWGFGKLGAGSPALLGHVASGVAVEIGEVNGQGVSNLARQLAACKPDNEWAAEELLASVPHVVLQFEHQSPANAPYTHFTRAAKGQSLFGALHTAPSSRIVDLEHQDLSNSG